MDDPELKNEGRVEMVVHDLQGAEEVAAVAYGEDVTRIEEALRASGRRVSRLRLIRPRRHPAGITAEDFARFNELLASSVRRGVPMPEGLQRLGRDLGSGRFRTATGIIEQKLRQGVPLGEAFADVRAHFPPLYGRILEAGAASGRLSDILLKMGRNVRVAEDFRRCVIEASVYPVLLLLVCGMLLGGFAGAILPRMEQAAAQMPMRIPWFTRVMIASDLPTQLLGTLVAIIALVCLLWLMKGERVLRRLPVAGPFYEANLWSNAADTLSLLIEAEVPAPAAMRLTAAASDSPWLGGVLDRISTAIIKGMSLSDAARLDSQAPEPFVRALELGERRGRLGAALSELAERYRIDARRRARWIVRYLPALFALLFGVIVFLVAVCILGPFFEFWGAPW